MLYLNLLDLLRRRRGRDRSCCRYLCTLCACDGRMCRGILSDYHDSGTVACRALRDCCDIFLLRRHFLLLHAALQLNHLVLVHFVHFELDVAVLRHEDLRWPRVLSVCVVLDAVFTTNEFGAFAFCVVLEVRAARNTLILVALLMRLLLAHVELLVDGVMQLGGFERVRSNNLNLP